jgi:hypothetical protein
MMRSIALLSVAAFAAIALVPAASALDFVPPPNPNPQCQPTSPPTHGGLQGEVEQLAYDTTTGACGIVNNDIGTAKDIEAIGYTFTMNEVNIVVNAIRGPVDQTQDNFCESVHGDPNANSPECKDIVVDLSGVTVNTNIAALNIPPLPSGF